MQVFRDRNEVEGKPTKSILIGLIWILAHLAAPFSQVLTRSLLGALKFS